MPEDLRLLLVILFPSLVVGWVVGNLLRSKKPTWSKGYAAFCLNRKWWIFLLGLIFFSGLAAMSFSNDRAAFGVLFLAFAGLQLFAIVSFGFKDISAEQTQAIQQSQPEVGAFQYRYWWLLLGVVAGSLWLWALITWA